MANLRHTLWGRCRSAVEHSPILWEVLGLSSDQGFLSESMYFLTLSLQYNFNCFMWWPHTQHMVKTISPRDSRLKTQKHLFDHYLHFLKLHIINNYINSSFIWSRRLPLRPHGSHLDGNWFLASIISSEY